MGISKSDSNPTLRQYMYQKAPQRSLKSLRGFCLCGSPVFSPIKSFCPVFVYLTAIVVSTIGYHTTMPLTAKQVFAAQPKDKPYKLTHANRLYLYVAISGAKSWRCNYLDGGTDKTKPFGQYPAMSLADARMAHVKFRDLQDAPASDTAPTFMKVAEAWLKIKLPTLSNPKNQLQVAKTIKQYV